MSGSTLLSRVPTVARTVARHAVPLVLAVLPLLAGAWLVAGGRARPDTLAVVDTGVVANADLLGVSEPVPGVDVSGTSVPTTRAPRTSTRAPVLEVATASFARPTPAVGDVPLPALRAYRAAEKRLAADDPSCRLSWSLVAAIGRVESNHGRYGGSVVGPDGRSTPRIRGIALDGTHETARIPDTDRGLLDGDPVWDRAVGPMQFIPSTWAIAGADGDGDRRRDPDDLDDAALATAAYLCAGSEDLSTPAGAAAAVFRYNHSDAYVTTVLALAAAYASGTPVAELPAVPAAQGAVPKLPPSLPPATVTQVRLVAAAAPSSGSGSGGAATTAAAPAPAKSSRPRPGTGPGAPGPRPTGGTGTTGSPAPDGGTAAASPSTSPGAPAPAPSDTAAPAPGPTTPGCPSPAPSPTGSAVPSATPSPSPTDAAPTTTPTVDPSASADPSVSPTASGTPAPTPSC